MDDDHYQNGQSIWVLECLNQVEAIQKNIFSNSPMNVRRLLDPYDTKESYMSDDIQVTWGEPGEMYLPPEWLNHVTLADINQKLGYTEMIWQVDMRFIPYGKDAFIGASDIFRSFIAAELIVREFDKRVYLDYQNDGFFGKAVQQARSGSNINQPANYTRLAGARDLVIIESRDRSNLPGPMFYLQLNFGIQFAILFGRDYPVLN